MPVNEPNQEYQDSAEQWHRIRDVLAGSDAVKASPWKYLRRPQGLAWDEGAEYVKSATFFGATGRTLDGLTGAIFRKPPEVVLPERWRDLEGDATATGVPLAVLAQMLTREVIAIGRAGAIVDMPVGGGRPYLRMYAAENIINWRTTMLDGRPVLSLVVLRENGTRVDPQDRFASEPVERFLVLELVRPGGANSVPVYSTSVFEIRQDRGVTAIEQVAGPFFPKRRGEPLDFIPFQFFATDNLDAAISQSPLLPLVEVNLSHFNTSASIEHGAWWTALPVYYVAGGFHGDGAKGTLSVGASTAWALEKGATASILEYKGTGLEALERRLERKEQHMAVLGARLLEDQKAGVEAAETVALRHRGENSVLANIAGTVSRGLTNALRWAVWWAGSAESPAEAEASISLNTDFVGAAMSASELTALMSAWQSGGIGNRTLHHNLEQGERLPDDMDLDAFEEDQSAHGSDSAFMGLGNGHDHGRDESIN